MAAIIFYSVYCRRRASPFLTDTPSFVRYCPRRTGERYGFSSVVLVSSHGHYMARGSSIDDFQLATLNDPAAFVTVDRYRLTKLANVLMAREAARRLQSTPVYVNAIMPGLVKTGAIALGIESIGASLPSAIASLAVPVLEGLSSVAWSADQGALTQLYCATNATVRGRLFRPIAVEANPSAVAQDEQLASQLWELSQRLVAGKYKG